MDCFSSIGEATLKKAGYTLKGDIKLWRAPQLAVVATGVWPVPGDGAASIEKVAATERRSLRLDGVSPYQKLLTAR